MKLALFLFLFTFSAMSAVKMELEFHDGKLRQGDIVKATVKLDTSSVQKLSLKNYAGQTFGETLHFFEISSLIKRETSDQYEAEAKVTFLKVPTGNSITQAIQNEQVTISWSPVTVEPVEVPKQFLFGSFEVPSRKQFLLWGIGALILIALILVIMTLMRKLKTRRQEKQKLSKFKVVVLEANSLPDIIEVWKKKQSLINVFPHLKEPFDKLEMILFKYMFKPSMKESEVKEMLSAYREFVSSVAGGFNGI